MLRLSLLDAAGAAQSSSVHAAVRTVLAWPSASPEDTEAHERYLVALATAAHPPRPLVKGQLGRVSQGSEVRMGQSGRRQRSIRVG